MKRIVGILSVACLLVGGLCACSPKTDEPASPTTSGTTTAPSATVQGDMLLNTLTGEYSLNKADGNRPIGVMIANDSSTRGKQAGIDKADFYLETETEGAIPRLLAVFGNASRIPSKLGPVRSARSPFIMIARGLDAVYCHAGGSSPAKATLKTGVVTHIDALTDSKTFWRDSALKAAMDYVHSVATSGEKMVARVKKSGYATTTQKQLFTFGNVAGSQPAEKIQLKTTPSHTASFIYDSASKTYGKNIGTLGNAKPHKSLEGNQIKVTNVVVLYAEKFVEETYSNGTNVYNFRTGSGNGYLASGGTVRPIRYTLKADGVSLFEEDGSAAKFATGKTYMCLADKNLSGKFSAS